MSHARRTRPSAAGLLRRLVPIPHAAQLGLLVLASLLLLPVPRGGAEPASRSGETPSLDQLLKVPEVGEFETEKRGGATRNEWRHRFGEAHEQVQAGKAALRKTREELATTVGSKDDWQFSPPGMPSGASTDSTANFQLRQEVKRQRAEVARAQMRLRELEIEANLAGVPEDWRAPVPEARSRHGSGTQAGSSR